MIGRTKAALFGALLITSATSSAAIQQHTFSIAGNNGETGTGTFTWDDAVVSNGDPLSESTDSTGNLLSVSISISGGNVIGGSTTFTLAECEGAFLQYAPDFVTDINFWCTDGVGNRLEGLEIYINRMNNGASQLTFTPGTSAPFDTTVTIGGAVSGLAPGESVVLQNNGGDDLTQSADGSFTFSTAIDSGTNYDVSVLTQPANQTCAVSNGTGTANDDVTDVSVSCTNNDTDADGIDDAVDPFPNADTQESVAGVTLTTTPGTSSSSCSIDTLGSLSAFPSTRPLNLESDIDVAVDYALTGCSAGESILVTVDFGVAIPAGGKVYKVAASGWTEVVGATISGTSATYTLTDNGALDQDPTVGRIQDPVTVAVPRPARPATAIPALPLTALWILGGFAGLLGLRQLRKAA